MNNRFDIQPGDRILLKTIEVARGEMAYEGTPDSIDKLAIMGDMIDCFGREATVLEVFRGKEVYARYGHESDPDYYEFSIDILSDGKGPSLRHFNCAMVDSVINDLSTEPDIDEWSAIAFI